MIARHYHDVDHGVDALKHLWREVLATPSLPIPRGFEMPSLDILQREVSVWSTQMFGNSHLFTAPNPNLLAVARSDSAPMERTLEKYVGTYGPTADSPRLIVTAVDVEAGSVRAFDSGCEPVTPAKVVACGSFPPGYPAKKIGDHYYWDGGLWSNTPLAEVLDALRQHPCGEEAGGYQVYVVDVFPQHATLPQNAVEVQERAFDITLADKISFDVKMTERLNQHIQFVDTLHQRVHQLPPELKALIEAEHRRSDRRRSGSFWTLRVSSGPLCPTTRSRVASISHVSASRN
jgi:hypothetical protein